MTAEGRKSSKGAQDSPRTARGRLGSSVGDERDEDVEEAGPEAEGSEAAGGEQPTGGEEFARDADATSSWGGRWWATLGVLLAVELFVYGRRGELEVCVGKETVHDFGLRGQERTDANRWKFPRCESAMNLGLRSHYDERVEEAAKVACRGATLFRNRGEGESCIAATDGWEHRVNARYVWPWDSRFYEHLFWFLQ
jgi:hypothetical protein